MFRILFLMLVLLAGLIAGPYLAGNQGYVLIRTASDDIKMSITTLVIIFVIVIGIIYAVEWLLTRFIRLSNSSYSWFSRRKRAKAQKQTLEGLMRMNEGDYSRAEKLIGKNAKHSDEPILNFIKAAEAAQQRGDEFSANRYLGKATEAAGSDNLMVEIARTRILLQQRKLPAARSSVDSLLIMAPRNREVVKLAAKIYQKSKAYQALDDILPQLESSGSYSAEEFVTLRHRVTDGLLDEKMNEEGADGLLAWWEEQSRKRHNDRYVRVGLIRRLIDCNDHESAYELTLETLKKTEEEDDISKELLAQITRLQPTDSSKLIKLLEKQSRHSDEKYQCRVYRALGYLHVRNADFTKAGEAFRHVVSCQDHIEPHDVTMAGYVFEQTGDTDAAKRLREESLKSAMAIKPPVIEPTAILLENKG